jgi:hypothetical protein
VDSAWTGLTEWITVRSSSWGGHKARRENRKKYANKNEMTEVLAAVVVSQPTFRRSKDKPSKRPELYLLPNSRWFHAWIFFLDLEDGSDMFLRNIGFQKIAWRNIPQHGMSFGYP